ncbi:hypothetical protein ACFZDP_49660, partial [Streptomyces mirabilis]
DTSGGNGQPDTNADGQTSTDTTGSGTTDTTHPDTTDTSGGNGQPDTNADGQTSTDTTGSGTTDTTHHDTNAGGQTSTDTSNHTVTQPAPVGTPTQPQTNTATGSHTSTDTNHPVKTRQGTNTGNKLTPDLTPSTTDTPSAKPKVPPKPLEPLTPVQEQEIACASGGISKIGKALKIIKDGKVVQTLEDIGTAGNGLVIGKEFATGELYEMAWDVAEQIPWPPGTGQVISCIRVLDKMSQEDAAKFEASIIKSSDLENTLKKNKAESVKIQQAPGVQQNQLSTGSGG